MGDVKVTIAGKRVAVASIDDAKAIAIRRHAAGVIVFAFDLDGGYGAASYGENRAQCQRFGKVLDAIAEHLDSGSIAV